METPGSAKSLNWRKKLYYLIKFLKYIYYTIREPDEVSHITSNEICLVRYNVLVEMERFRGYLLPGWFTSSEQGPAETVTSSLR